jgi:hypothetical protein
MVHADFGNSSHHAHFKLIGGEGTKFISANRLHEGAKETSEIDMLRSKRDLVGSEDTKCHERLQL